MNTLMQQMESNQMNIIEAHWNTDNAINLFQYTIKMFVFARLLLQLIPALWPSLSSSIYCYFYGVQLFDSIVVAVVVFFCAVLVFSLSLSQSI